VSWKREPLPPLSAGRSADAGTAQNLSCSRVQASRLAAYIFTTFYLLVSGIV